MTLEDALRSLAKDCDPPVRSDESDEQLRGIADTWLRIARIGNGDLLCIDLDPAPGGTVGQIVEFRHDDAARKRLGVRTRR